MKQFLFILLILLTCLLTFPVLAAEISFRVYHNKTITPNVERFYGQDQNPFATMVCKEGANQVMIVDSRLRDLDGKSFFFESEQACKEAREQADRMAKKCKAELIIDTETQKAHFKLSNCREF